MLTGARVQADEPLRGPRVQPRARQQQGSVVDLARGHGARLYVPRGHERGLPGSRETMPTTKQRQAARANVKKAQAGARRKQTLKNLPARTRTALGQEAAAVRRGDSPTRRELEAEARRLDIPGRSKMGKDELKRAVARAR